LFNFFVAGLAAIESFSYGLCWVAWEAHPKRVSLAALQQKKGVSPESTRDRFKAHFPGASVTRTLPVVIGSHEYREWSDIRNVLAHRTIIPRAHYASVGVHSPPPRPTEWASP
jgi:hypothetical protein